MGAAPASPQASQHGHPPATSCAAGAVLAMSVQQSSAPQPEVRSAPAVSCSSCFCSPLAFEPLFMRTLVSCRMTLLDWWEGCRLLGGAIVMWCPKQALTGVKGPREPNPLSATVETPHPSWFHNPDPS